MDWDDEGEDSGRIPNSSRASVPLVKKKPLRNKSLSIGFDEKNLQDFVTGFHKRKKKRRKEAQHHLEEKARLWRIEQRKKRKLEIDLAYGNPVQNGENPDGTGDELGDDEDELGRGDEDDEAPAISVGKTVYDNGDTTVTVTTSDLCAEDDTDVRVWNHEAEKQASNVKRKLVNRLMSIKDSGKLSFTKQGPATLHGSSHVTNDEEMQPTAKGIGWGNPASRKYAISIKKNPLNTLNKLKERRRRKKSGKPSGMKKGSGKGSRKHNGEWNRGGLDSSKARGKKRTREHS